MEPRHREPKRPGPKAEPEPPQVEGGETDQATPEAAPQPAGGMIGEGGRSDGGGAREGDREGGMIGQG